MTNAQKWIASFLFIFILLFLLGKETKKENNQSIDIDEFNKETTTEQSISQIIDNVGCNRCHGDNLQGTKLAPSLVNVGVNWNRAELINYLRNPDSYGNDERFIEYKKKYKIPMTPFSSVDVKILGKIADYVLELK